jgi:hypothetical protein
MTVQARQGGIELAVPAGSRFTLEASSSGGGEVTANAAGFTIVESGPMRVTGTMGGGGSKLTLSAEGGNVDVRTAATATTDNHHN